MTSEWVLQGSPARPPTHKPMKRQPVIFLGAAILLLMGSPWISAVLADIRAPANTLGPASAPAGCPLNRNCVVTVDPLSSSKPVIAGDANIVTGFVAPDTVEGTLIRFDDEWLVLRAGRNENWIPKSKVIMIHFCD